MKHWLTQLSLSLTVTLAAASCSMEPVTTPSGGTTPPAAGAPEADAPAAETPATDAATAQAEEGNATQLAAAPGAAPGEVAREAAPPYFNPLTPEQIADGWISLFDGHTLFGWRSNVEGINWSVKEGAIVADEGPIGLLLTDVPFADYELLCDFRMSAGGNSGIFLRTLVEPKQVDRDCYELNIVDEHPAGFLTGSLVGRAKPEAPLTGSGDWKTFRVRCEGPRITVHLDDQSVLDFTDESEGARASGLIGLQKNVGSIEFRNILLRPLGTQPLFNGQDLSGWRVVPGSKSEFNVADGRIDVTNGQGFLETEGVYGDFVFQCDAITHGKELNSGFFFRAMPGTEAAPSNGYEVQIHNGFEEGDRTRPNNAGTGAIFRRTTARRVVSRDNEWCTLTLVASGPRLAVWVNGYAVTDWEDEREPDENPRKGKRLDAGHISLQGHDPTTDLSFRNLKIAELPGETGP